MPLRKPRVLVDVALFRRSGVRRCAALWSVLALCGAPGGANRCWRATPTEDRPHQHVGIQDDTHHALCGLTAAGQVSQDGVE
jgi:hypothetical protein